METGKGYSREEYMNRIENNEVDVYELFKYMLRKWKSILALCVGLFLICMLMLVLLSGSGDDASETTIDQLTQEQQNKVKNAFKLYDELQDMIVYENSSAYMGLNPYECHITTLQYMITDKTAAGNSFKAYKAFVESGQLKKTIEDELGQEMVKPSELISLSTYEQQSMLENRDTDIELSQILSVKILASDESTNGKIVQIVKKSFEEYHQYMLSVIKNHEIKLLSENSYIGADQGVRNSQSAFEIEMDRKKTQITNIEGGLKGEEKEILEQLKTNGGTEKDTVAQKSRFSVKALILSLIISVCLSCMIAVCYYMFRLNHRVKSGQDIVSIFGLPCLGEIMKKSTAEDSLTLQEELEILCSRNDLCKIFVSLMTPTKDVEICVGMIKDNLKKKGIELMIGANISEDIEAMKTVQGYEKIILMSESKRTTYSSIDKVLQKCNNWGIDVVGIINYRG